MQQYFYDKEIDGNSIVLNEEQNHHIKNVMRMKAGSLIRIVDSSKTVFIGEVNYNQNIEIINLTRSEENSEADIEITLIAGLLKKEKWEWMIQKACEVGVTKIIPMNTSRTIVKMDRQDKKKLARFNKIALEACEQARRNHLVTIEDVIDFKNIKEYCSELNFIAYEAFTNLTSLKNNLKQCRSITIIIGPEGGFSKEEIDFAVKNNYQAISLGKRILRAETASIVAINTIVNYFE